jgi:hypothetical protein
LVNFDRVLVVAGRHWHRSLEMSALGQKQTFKRLRLVSALPPKADIGCGCWDVRFVPEAEVAVIRSVGSLIGHLLRSLEFHGPLQLDENASDRGGIST